MNEETKITKKEAQFLKDLKLATEIVLIEDEKLLKELAKK